MLLLFYRKTHNLRGARTHTQTNSTEGITPKRFRSRLHRGAERTLHCEKVKLYTEARPLPSQLVGPHFVIVVYLWRNYKGTDKAVGRS